MPTEAPFGSWRSPLTAELIVQASVGLGGPAFAAGDVWWSELRPTEAGRVQIVRKPLNAPPEAASDVLPEGFSARTRAHEYGGGAWWLHASDEGDGDGGVTLFVTNWSDQRLYRVDRAGTDQPAEPVAITPEPDQPHGFRYADGRVTPDGRWVVCVREWHGAPGATEARNELVAIPTNGSAEPIVLVGGPDGPDFVSSPRISPDGTRLCWLQWHHPDMPWDATELWRAQLADPAATPPIDGSTVEPVPIDAEAVEPVPVLSGAERIAGGRGESIAQPEWDPEGQLWFASDIVDGRWQRFAVPHDGDAPEPRSDTDGEEAQPQWVFGQSSYCFPAAGRSLAVARGGGRDHLVYPPGSPEPLSYTAIEGLVADDGTIGFVGGSFRSEAAIVTVTADGITVQRPARDLGLGDEWFSIPEHIEFPTTPNADGSPGTAYALFYAPANPDHVGPAGTAPPLVVMSHGGPTSAARSQLNLSVQYWTSRGFAVVDVNYRGSTGYGRAYREALNDRWGIADVDDCIAAARYLAAEGRVDGDRLAIRGGSAGGYTTLCALTFHDEFTAGCSMYGIADLEALATDTHKFESRYLDRLVGPYPERRDLYVERSPIHHTDRLATPLIILQGLEDEVVPPAQAEMMVDALRRKGVPFAYLAFEGEQHGFRQAPNIRRALEAELYFYAQVFGFDLADPIEPVVIEPAIERS